jgi:putative hydrolase of HD superfamily
MPSIRKSLLQLVFQGSFMKRWNDKRRSMEFVEVDKQAHKMLTAWALTRLNSRDMSPEDRLRLEREVIEGGLFDYFYRLIITDIKPPIFYQIKANPEHYRKLTSWVLSELEPRLQPLGKEFWERLSRYLLAPDEKSLARDILDAAHLYASTWEYNLIKQENPWDEELLEIESSFRDGLAKHEGLIGVTELKNAIVSGEKNTLGRFCQICGQLRFQKRWSQTPRIPETSVLGHMFIVAAYAYFLGLAAEACTARLVNDFFAGLFHDLPELLTRDIISPVKQSIEPMQGLIQEYEQKALSRLILGPLGKDYPGLAERLSYYLGLEVGSEFADTVVEDGRIKKITPAEIAGRYNHDRFDPKDGEMLKICDSLAAFIEAYITLQNGITSSQLQQAVWRIKTMYASKAVNDTLHIGALLADFD